MKVSSLKLKEWGVFSGESTVVRRCIGDADAWGVKRVGDSYVGPNLLGRLLMQLRDADGRLAYQLPANILRFTKSITIRSAE